MTLREVLAEGAGTLKAAGIETPGLDAALLLGEVLRLDRAGLLLRQTEPVSEADRLSYAALLNRRREGECVAYILGRKEFRGLTFAVTPAVLVPRPDTETLVSAALEYIDRVSGECTLLDMCTGSGAVGIAVKYERPQVRLFLSDISPTALAVARENARRLLGEDVPCIESGLFDRITGGFTLITANPPYIPSDMLGDLPAEVRREPLVALDGGDEGLAVIRRLIAGAESRLQPEGRLLLEADPRQMRRIRELLAGWRDVKTYNDLAGRERVVGAGRHRLLDAYSVRDLKADILEPLRNPDR